MIVHLKLYVDPPESMRWDDVAERVREHVDGQSIRLTAGAAIVIDSAEIDQADEPLDEDCDG